MSTDAFEQLIDVAAPGGGSYPVQRGHRRGVRSPHTFDAARWPPSSLTSPYAPQGSTTAVLGGRGVTTYGGAGNKRTSRRNALDPEGMPLFPPGGHPKHDGRTHRKRAPDPEMFAPLRKPAHLATRLRPRLPRLGAAAADYATRPSSA